MDLSFENAFVMSVVLESAILPTMFGVGFDPADDLCRRAVAQSLPEPITVRQPDRYFLGSHGMSDDYRLLNL